MRIFILTLLLINSTTFAQQNKINFCHAALTDTTGLSFTDIFIVYLQELHKENIVTNKTLRNLQTELEKQTALSNPAIKNSSNYEIHAGMVQSYLTNSQLDRVTLLKLLTEFLNKQTSTKEEKDRSHEKTKIPSREARFHPIQSGSFPEMRFEAVGEGITKTIGKKEYQTAIPHSFLMMDIKVTRQFWFQVYSKTSLSKENADLPMVKITFLSAMAFANELSKREGLKPVYILDPHVLDPNTNAEDGTLALKEHLELPPASFIDAPSGDLYQTEGYRLPSIHEQFFVRTNRGQVRSDQLFPGLSFDINNITDYGWLKENSGDLQFVAGRLPFVINGNDFYDLIGNATEYAHPHPSAVFTSAYIGTSYRSHKTDVTNLTFILGYPDLLSSDDETGFRLVRTIKEKP